MNDEENNAKDDLSMQKSSPEWLVTEQELGLGVSIDDVQNGWLQEVEGPKVLALPPPTAHTNASFLKHWTMVYTFGDDKFHPGIWRDPS